MGSSGRLERAVECNARPRRCRAAFSSDPAPDTWRSICAQRAEATAGSAAQSTSCRSTAASTSEMSSPLKARWPDSIS